MTSIYIRELMAESGVAFGTSGARGLVSRMTGSVCAAYTMAFLQSLDLARPGRKIALGIDLRPSSPDIARACALGMRRMGCEPVFCGVLPTPALAWYALSHAMPALMVTGSHIPFDRNGIKFYTAQGEISKADEAAITNAQAELLTQPAGELPDIDNAATDLYMQRYLELFPETLLDGWRIGVYEHSSAARDCLKTVLAALGAEVVGLDRTDSFVPIDTEAVSREDSLRGRGWAAEYRLDAIVSTDGDGDRPLIGDETGNWLRGDIVGLLTAKFVGAKTVVAPVSCNTAIEKSGLFENVIRTRIGSPHVIAGMEQALAVNRTAVAGFEANGGFLAGEGLAVGKKPLAALPTRDAMLPALAVLALARQNSCPVSALTAGLPQRHTASDRLQDFPASDSKKLLDGLQSDAGACRRLWGGAMGGVAHCDLTDGLRLTFTNGEIVHLRPSGNAPELRCYAEADSEARAQALVAASLQTIAADRRH